MTWLLCVLAANVIAIVVLMSAVVFAVNPVASHLAAAGVERIVLERGGCYGRCPIYRLTIRSDGSASYTGEGFVRVRGTYRTSFYPRKFLQLADVLYHRGLFASRRSNLTVTDAPQTTLSVWFSNGIVATSVDNGFDGGNDIGDDISAARFTSTVSPDICAIGSASARRSRTTCPPDGTPRSAPRRVAKRQRVRKGTAVGNSPLRCRVRIEKSWPICARF